MDRGEATSRTTEAAFRAIALRHIARDDLLHLAAEATSALGILGPGNDRFGTNAAIYAAAIGVHLESATNSSFWSVRVNSLSKAAVLLRLCSAVDALDPKLGLGRQDRRVPATLLDNRTPRALLEQAQVILQGHGDRYRDVKLAQVMARELRLSGDHDAARVAANPADWDTYFTRSGAELHKANYALEWLFACLCQGDPEVIEATAQALRDMRRYWEDGLPSTWATRGRYDQAVALANLVSAPSDGELRLALEGLEAAEKRFATYTSHSRVERLVETLSVLITHAELSLTTATLFDDVNEAARFRDQALASCGRALQQIESLRREWTVVTRTPSPLSFLLRLMLGDLAQVAAEFGQGRDAALLGLRLSLTAKHGGIAELIRAQRAEISEEGILASTVARSFQVLVNQLVDAERSRAVAPTDLKRTRADAILTRLRLEIPEQLAALVFPEDVTDAEVVRISALASERVVVDFVELPTLSLAAGATKPAANKEWFSTTLFTPDHVEFRRLQPGGGFDLLFNEASFYDEEAQREGTALDMFHLKAAAESDAWRLATPELLHPELARQLSAPTSDVQLLISPHGDLGRLPWVALLVEKDTRLVERAQVLLVPLLTGFKGLANVIPGSPALVAVVNSTTTVTPCAISDPCERPGACAATGTELNSRSASRLRGSRRSSPNPWQICW